MSVQKLKVAASNNSAPTTNMQHDYTSDAGLEAGDQNSSELLERRQQQLPVTRDTDVAVTRFEQARRRLARLGKHRSDISLHEVFERSRHFYFPQRLWIAFSVANVGIVFFFAVYMFGIKALCVKFSSYRMDIMKLFAQINGFIGAAPTYLQVMLGNVNSLQDLGGASNL